MLIFRDIYLSKVMVCLPSSKRGNLFPEVLCQRFCICWVLPALEISSRVWCMFGWIWSQLHDGLLQNLCPSSLGEPQLINCLSCSLILQIDQTARAAARSHQSSPTFTSEHPRTSSVNEAVKDTSSYGQLLSFLCHSFPLMNYVGLQFCLKHPACLQGGPKQEFLNRFAPA